MDHRKRNIILGTSFVVLLLASYLFSISKTLGLKQRVAVFKKEKELLSNVHKRIIDLQQENSYLDSILKQKNVSIENSFQQTLLKKLNVFSKNKTIEILAFDEPHEVIQQKTQMNTYFFEVKANFNTLLKLVNTFEKLQLGKLISVTLEKRKNYRSNREELIGQFYVQKLNQVE